KLEFTLHAMAYNLSRAVALILWMIFSLLFVQTKIRKRENLHGGILLKKNSTPFATASLIPEDAIPTAFTTSKAILPCRWTT
ncbi:hypothetical protein, partial [Arsenophonus sp. ENCA]|uniref:hypothetical protein n=1 Tax=Arsenophonus sp. ENCA TaxID=1987579 RepID=UPI0025C0F55D